MSHRDPSQAPAARASTLIETIATYRCHGGTQGFYRHRSQAIGAPMRFGVFVPGDIDVVGSLMFLAGLTCNEETFAIKAGAQRDAAEHGLILITPDTSPRETDIDGATADWDFGEGAGFYLDATEPPWSSRFRMESYLVNELPPLIVEHFGVDARRLSIAGHSMGGHGALTLALRHPGRFRSVSALAPIASAADSPWGEKAFGRYLGDDRAAWLRHDASALMRTMDCPYPGGILIDQGLADRFLVEQLRPEAFEAACRSANQPLTLRLHAGYDHGYYFLSTFFRDHIAFHAKALAD